MTAHPSHLAVYLDDAVRALEAERHSLLVDQDAIAEALSRIDEALDVLRRDDPPEIAAAPVEPRSERPALPAVEPTREGWARAVGDAKDYVDSLRLRCPVAGCDKQRLRNVQGLRIHLTNGHRGLDGSYLARPRRAELMALAERAAAGEQICPVSLDDPPAPGPEPTEPKSPTPSPVGGFKVAGDMACPAGGCEFSTALDRRLDRHLRDDHNDVYGGFNEADVEYRAEAVRQARKDADAAAS